MITKIKVKGVVHPLMIDSSLLYSGLMLEPGTNKLMLNVGSGLTHNGDKIELFVEETSPLKIRSNRLCFLPSESHTVSWLVSGLQGATFHLTSGLVFDSSINHLGINIHDTYFWGPLVESLVASGFVRNT